MEIKSFPPTLTFLRLSTKFNLPVDNLPPSLVHLEFSDYFNQPVDRLPPSLTHLILGDRFGHYLDNLPAGLTHLVIAGMFNRPVDHLPASLTHLVFGRWYKTIAAEQDSAFRLYRFDQAIDHLPPSLTHLVFGDISPENYMYQIDKNASAFNQPFHSLPNSLIFLKLGRTFDQPASTLPTSLRILYCHTTYPPLPPSLTHLWIRAFQSIKLPSLPNLTHLSILHKGTDPLPNFPRLKYLSIGYYDTNIPINLFHLLNLTHICFLNCTEFVLPPQATHLFLSMNYHTPLPRLPPSLTHLGCGNAFNHPVDLPPSLKFLMFGHDFDQPLRNLPRLTILYLHINKKREYGEQYYKTHPVLPAGVIIKEQDFRDFFLQEYTKHKIMWCDNFY